MSEAAKFCCLLGLEREVLVQLQLHQLPVFRSFLYCLSLAVLKLALLTKLVMNSENFKLHQLSDFNDDLHRLSLAVLELTL